MKLLKPRNFVIFALTALSGTVLLHTSQSVQHAEDQIGQLEASIDREQEKLHLLKAEWASLNRPERLERLAKEFLDLAPPQPETTTDDAANLPDVHTDDNPLFQDEGTGAALQPVVMEQPVKAPPKPAVKKETPQKQEPKAPAKTDDKAFGDLMKELNVKGGAP